MFDSTPTPCAENIVPPSLVVLITVQCLCDLIVMRNPQELRGVRSSMIGTVPGEIDDHRILITPAAILVTVTSCDEDLHLSDRMLRDKHPSR